MHIFNPLTLSNIISEIIQKLPLEDLEKFCWINQTWYKEIQHELRKRWKIQVFEFDKLEQERDKAYYDLYRKYPPIGRRNKEEWDKIVQGEDTIYEYYENMQFKTAKNQVEIEKYETILWNYVDDWNVEELLEQV
ncbi:23402_t:CDS:2 [Gigaspora margarita]|uniref:23402_t:CDS:1 n=1 Tax=Gigaspora margarita TaxID=4874 RepID=A0ABN7UP93_GIGMA|nr:23402_t:CDS:2 [Gigaspora margarita]